MLSVPTVISGGDDTLHSPADAGTIEIMLTFEKQSVVLALEVHSSLWAKIAMNRAGA